MDILEKVYCLPNKHVHLLCLFHWFYFEITAKTCYHSLLSELQSHWKDLNLSTAFHPGLNVLKPPFVGSTMLVQHNPTFLVHVTSSNITWRMIISVIYATFAAAKKNLKKTLSSNIVGLSKLDRHVWYEMSEWPNDQFWIKLHSFLFYPTLRRETTVCFSVEHARPRDAYVKTSNCIPPHLQSQGQAPWGQGCIKC